MGMNNSDYTPTTERVRDNYAYGASACGCCAEYRDEDYEKFDLWLAAHDAEVAAKTLGDAADELEATTHAWGKAAWIDVMRARAEAYRKAAQNA